jgi:hypothetical protein
VSTTEDQVRREQAAHEEEMRARADGKSLEEQAQDEDEDFQEEPQLIIPGTEGVRLSNTVGGKRPTESRFKIRSISLPIMGNVQLDKDSEFWVAVKVGVDEISHRNRRDAQTIVAVVREHVAVPLSAPIFLDEPPVEE